MPPCLFVNLKEYQNKINLVTLYSLISIRLATLICQRMSDRYKRKQLCMFIRFTLCFEYLLSNKNNYKEVVWSG